MSLALDNLNIAFDLWNVERLENVNKTFQWDEHPNLTKATSLAAALEVVYPVDELKLVKWLLDKLAVSFTLTKNDIQHPDPDFKASTSLAAQGSNVSSKPVSTFTIPTGTVSFVSQTQNLLWYITPATVVTLKGEGMAVVSNPNFPGAYIGEPDDGLNPSSRLTSPPTTLENVYKGKRSHEPQDPLSEYTETLTSYKSTKAEVQVQEQAFNIAPQIPMPSFEQIGTNDRLKPLRVSQKRRRRFVRVKQSMVDVISLISPLFLIGLP